MVEISKNNEAVKIVGKRKAGEPIFLPYELGYACPICNSCDEVSLEFSEYAGFMYCSLCNLDIPSCLCCKFPQPNVGNEPLSAREKIVQATQVYLDCVREAKE